MKTGLRFEDDLTKNLAGLAARVSRQVKIDALLEAAEPIRRRAAQLAPRRRPDDPRTPNLADNIGVSVVRAAAGDAAVAVGPTSNVHWGRFQELGTAHNTAHPFLRPAFDAEAPKAFTIIAPAIWTALAGRGISRSVSAPSAPSAPSGPGRGI